MASRLVRFCGVCETTSFLCLSHWPSDIVLRSGTGAPSDVSGWDLTQKYKRDGLSERRHVLVSGQTARSVFWTQVRCQSWIQELNQCISVSSFDGTCICSFPSSEILGQEDHWNILLCIPALFSMVQVLVLPLLPDSPRYLFIEKGDENACKTGWSWCLLLLRCSIIRSQMGGPWSKTWASLRQSNNRTHSHL